MDELNSGEFRALGSEMLPALRHFVRYHKETKLTKSTCCAVVETKTL